MYREQLIASPSPDATIATIGKGVLIVIPCLNERAHIEKLIIDTLNDTAGLDRLIAVVDGGSTDGTEALLADIAAREPDVVVLHNPKRLQSAGMNLAVKAFGEGRRWLVRLDAHAGYPRGYIQALIGEAHRTGASSVVVAMRSQGDHGFQGAVALAQNSVLGAGGSPHRRAGKAAFVDHGHHALFELRQFAAIGGYDETLSHNEDAEFDIRLARVGGRIWLTRDVEIAYFPRATIAPLYRQYANYGRGRAITLLRHRQRPKLRQVLPLGVAPAVAALLFLPWFAWIAVPALSWAALCLIAGAALGLRQGIGAAFATGIAAITMHLGWSVGFWHEVLSRWGHRKSNADAALLGANEAAP